LRKKGHLDRAYNLEDYSKKVKDEDLEYTYSGGIRKSSIISAEVKNVATTGYSLYLDINFKNKDNFKIKGGDNTQIKFTSRKDSLKFVRTCNKVIKKYNDSVTKSLIMRGKKFPNLVVNDFYS